MKNKKHIIIWLLSGFFMIYIMVIIGGITRLTGSGLSIADWKPIMGALPPMNDIEWNDKFELYKTTPEFKEKNNTFNLSEFKSIFWWEFIHRNLGRLIGIVFLIPFIIFLIKRSFKKTFLRKMIFLLFLGSFQGVLGWYMVYSGLIDVPYVSHLRLAAHFITAISVMCYIFWIILELKPKKETENYNKLAYKLSIIFTCIVTMQLIYGAFTAGLDAGFGYSRLLDIINFPNSFGNIINHSFTVLFIHRYLGILLLISVLILKLKVNIISNNIKVKRAVNLLLISIIIQCLLGMSTLILNTPIVLAVIHQGFAVLVLLACIYMIHCSRR